MRRRAGVPHDLRQLLLSDDGRLVTAFTNEDRVADPRRTPTDPGCVHHIAFSLSQATFEQAVGRRVDELIVPPRLRNRFVPVLPAVSEKRVRVGPGHNAVTVTPVPRSSSAIASPKLST